MDWVALVDWVDVEGWGVVDWVDLVAWGVMVALVVDWEEWVVKGMVVGAMVEGVLEAKADVDWAAKEDVVEEDLVVLVEVDAVKD